MKRVLLLIFLTLTACTEKRIDLSAVLLPADGISSGKATLVKGYLDRDAKLTISLNGAAEILGRGNDSEGEHVYFRSSGRAGRAEFRYKDLVAYVDFVSADGADSDSDGFPDSAQLKGESDRVAFINWFVRIAESQFLKPSYAWKSAEHDCAGLVRFCYREALKKHDESWQKKVGVVVDKNLADVKAFSYPDIPVIGEKLFKVKKGAADDKSTFSTFADAETLIKHNAVLIGKEISEARRGDILFFTNEENRDFPYHSMIVSENDGGELTLVYHTGTGEVIKRVKSSYLKASPVFVPAAWNKQFLGVYRLKIVN